MSPVTPPNRLDLCSHVTFFISDILFIKLFSVFCPHGEKSRIFFLPDEFRSVFPPGVGPPV